MKGKRDNQSCCTTMFCGKKTMQKTASVVTSSVVFRHICSLPQITICLAKTPIRCWVTRDSKQDIVIIVLSSPVSYAWQWPLANVLGKENKTKTCLTNLVGSLYWMYLHEHFFLPIALKSLKILASPLCDNEFHKLITFHVMKYILVSVLHCLLLMSWKAHRF